MSVADVTTYFMSLSAAGTAAIALLRSGTWRLSKWLLTCIVFSALCDVATLARPSRCTPEFWTAREAAFAVLCALAALELGHGVLHPALRIWKAVCWRVMALLGVLSCVGFVALATSPGVMRVGYRGLLLVEAALVVLLALTLSAVSLYAFPRHPLAVAALRGLLRYSALQLLYIASWEASRRVAEVMVWPATLAFVWVMLDIAREALSHPAQAEASVASVTR